MLPHLPLLLGLLAAQDSRPAEASPEDAPAPPVAAPAPPRGTGLPVLEVRDATAATPAAMRPYTDRILGSKVTFDMVPVPGGTFRMGSPADEVGRDADEGPVREVALEPFWMGAHEVTWDAYHVFMLQQDKSRRPADPDRVAPQDELADAVSRPTPPYVPMDFNMGVDGYPAIAMTQFAAKQYTKWLTMKTGRFHRLATEAEWEYACRAGTTTAWSFGDDVDDLEEAGWFFDNADDQYQKVGSLPPNPWGLYDMHGNVAEWCLDGYDAKIHGKLEAGVLDPVNWATALYPRVVRGGSWDHDPEDLRSAARMSSRAGWKVQDPQIPKSIWYHTDAKFLGFRVVRVLTPPTPEQAARWWEADLEEVRTIEQRQRNGDR